MVNVLSEQSQHRLTNDFTPRILLRAVEVTFVLDQLLEVALLQVDGRFAHLAVGVVLDVLLQARWSEGFYQRRHR